MTKKNIYDEKFREICNTIIFLPDDYIKFCSGICIIFLYYKCYSSKKIELDFVWKPNSAKEQETFKHSNSFYYNNMQDYKQNVFFYNKSSYLEKLKDRLSISVCKDLQHRHTQLWKLFDLYGYATHNITGKTIAFSDDFIFDVVFVSNFILNKPTNKISDEYKIKKFFYTVVQQKIDDKKIKDIIDLDADIKVILLIWMITFKVLEQYIRRIIVADYLQSHKLKDVEKYQDLLNKIQEWMKDHSFLSFQENEKSKENKKSEKLPNIEVTFEDDLNLIIYWRSIMSENLSAIETIENASLFSPYVRPHNNQLRLYFASNPNHKVDVSKWCEFKTKFINQLKIFFPNVSDDELKASWVYAIIALLCTFNKPNDFKVDDIPRGRISEKWLENYAEDIRSINVKNIFALMHVYLNHHDVLAEMEGKNTIFFNKLIEGDKPQNSREKKLCDLIKSIKNHYRHSEENYSYHSLTFYMIFLLGKQENAFVIDDDIINLIKKLELSILKKIKEEIISAKSINDCKKATTKASKLLDDFHKELLGKIQEGKELFPDFKKFLDKYPITLVK